MFALRGINSCRCIFSHFVNLKATSNQGDKNKDLMVVLVSFLNFMGGLELLTTSRQELRLACFYYIKNIDTGNRGDILR
jgi:hypothetical protein